MLCNLESGWEVPDCKYLPDLNRGFSFFHKYIKSEKSFEISTFSATKKRWSPNNYASFNLMYLTRAKKLN